MVKIIYAHNYAFSIYTHIWAITGNICLNKIKMENLTLHQILNK